MYLNEESCHTDAFTEEIPGVLQALEGLKGEFARPIVDQATLGTAVTKARARVMLRNQRYAETVGVMCLNIYPSSVLNSLQVNAILDVAERPGTHVSASILQVDRRLMDRSGATSNSPSVSCTGCFGEMQRLRQP